MKDQTPRNKDSRKDKTDWSDQTPRNHTCWGCAEEDTCPLENACPALANGWVIVYQSPIGPRYLTKVGPANARFPGDEENATRFVTSQAAVDFADRIGLLPDVFHAQQASR